MKKLFYLCAAAALFAACSSDEIGEVQSVPQPTEPVAGEYASAGSVEFTNGVTMAVGALDESGVAVRAEEEADVEFCITLPTTVLRDFGEYKLLADDFAIRVDGEYVENLKIKDNSTTKFGVTLTEQDLKVAVKNLEKLNFNKVNDYTFETYLWIENKKLLNDGSGSYGELFTDTDKSNWIGGKGWPVAEDEETGVDLSESIYKGYNESSAGFTADSPAKGLLVKYNVYRGLQGRDGNTPYVKVSIHVEKPEPTTVGDAEGENECTYVNIPAN